MKLRLSLAAELDLTHIKDTIIARNPMAADRVRREITRALNLLTYFPHLGRPGSVEGTREKAVKSLSHVIVYTVEGGDVI